MVGRGLILRLVASAGCVAAVFWVAGAGDVAARLAGANAGWLAVCAICLVVVTMLMAVRWQRVAHALGLPLDLAVAQREYFLSSLVNQILPGGVAGDAARIFRVRKAADLRRAAQSVVIDRIIGQVALLAALALGLTVAIVLPGGIAWPDWAGVAGLALLVIGGLAMQSRAAPIATVADQLKLPAQLALAVAITTLLCFAFFAAARAVGADLPAGALFTLVPLVLTAMLVPLSIAGWGWREGAAAALFPLAGLDPASGVAAGIAYGTMLLVAATPAVVLVLLHRKSTPTSNIDTSVSLTVSRLDDP